MRGCDDVMPRGEYLTSTVWMRPAENVNVLRDASYVRGVAQYVENGAFDVGENGGIRERNP